MSFSEDKDCVEVYHSLLPWLLNGELKAKPSSSTIPSEAHALKRHTSFMQNFQCPRWTQSVKNLRFRCSAISKGVILVFLFYSFIVFLSPFRSLSGEVLPVGSLECDTYANNSLFEATDSFFVLTKKMLLVSQILYRDCSSTEVP